MFDYLRNLTKSSEEKRQELLTAYIDGELSPDEVQQFETIMAQDRALRAEVRALRRMQQQLRQAPRRRVPRNFTLDPAVYGAAASPSIFERLFGKQTAVSGAGSPALARAYPVLQTATALAAIMLIVVFGLGFLGGGGGASNIASAPAAEVVEVTRVVSETEMAAEAEIEVAAEAAEVEVAEAEATVDAVEELASDEELRTVEQQPGLLDDGGGEQMQSLDGGAGGEAQTAVPTPTPSALPRETPEPTPEPRVSGITQPPAEDGAAAAVADAEVVEPEATAVATVEPAAQSVVTSSPLLGWQIGLAIAFVLLLILTLIVRARVR